MTHSITIGQTLSGKTLLNKNLCNWYLSKGIGAVVLDPMNDPDWNAAGNPNFYKTADPGEFLRFVKNPDRCLQCALFVDEAGMALDKFADEFSWLTCQSRHHGHRAHIIAQRAQMVSVSIRSQCSTLYAFSINPKDAKTYAEDFNEAAILEAVNLPQGHYLKIERFCPVKRGRLW